MRGWEGLFLYLSFYSVANAPLQIQVPPPSLLDLLPSSSSHLLSFFERIILCKTMLSKKSKITKLYLI